MKKFGVALLILVILTAALAFATGVSTAKAEISGAKCGGGLTASITPVLTGTYDFTAVCIQHDKCYARYGISKGSCDQAFILNMLAECQRQPKATRPGCEHVAGEYHSAVARSGEAAYNRAQREALVAVFSGSYSGFETMRLTFKVPKGTPPPPKSFHAPFHLTVKGGVVQGGQALDVTASSPLLATATSAVGIPVPGFGVIHVNLHFSYALNGPATVKGDINSHLGAGGVVVDMTGTLSGTHSIGP